MFIGTGTQNIWRKLASSKVQSSGQFLNNYWFIFPLGDSVYVPALVYHLEV